MESWASLLDTLGGVPDGIVHLWSFGGEADFERCRELGFAAPLALAHEIGERGGEARLWAVADGLLEVDGDEELKPAAAILLGACRAISAHLPRIDCRLVDVPPPGPDGTRLERLAERLLAEFAAGAPERLVAYRGSHRWVPLLDELSAAIPPPQGAVCLLAGGLAAPGHSFARHLAQAGARLLLVEPAGSPTRQDLDRVRDLEARGAEVEILAVDLADEAALLSAVEAVEERWGAVTGLIHSASPVPSLEGALADGGDLLGARVRSILTLDALRRRRRPGFAFLVAPRGATAVAAAEASFLDALAAASGDAGWTSIAWGLETDGEAALDRLFAAGSTAQIIAAARPLQTGWSALDGLPEAAPGEVRTAVGFYPRPALRVELVAPRTATEEHIAKIWKDLLGVAQVGVFDNFLDLGGDSLLATRLVSRMRDAFQLDLPVRFFFERSTVADLAAAVEELTARRQAEEESEILQRIQALSEDALESEIRRLESLLAGGSAHG
jgi:acyl carrier protein